ncbi:MAG TPA: molybdenum hydroxylase, partial [Gammaproteobacteria bacterium]|nr:molybdenum hydroxylase [Gammaproteobacteria bacterium]
GLIASRHRAGLMRDDLMQSGLSPARWAHLRAPAGLDLGARMPAEIATAVIAELLAVRNGHSGQPRSIIKSDL